MSRKLYYMNIQLKCQVSTVIHLKFTAKNKICFSKTRVTCILYLSLLSIYLEWLSCLF